MNRVIALIGNPNCGKTTLFNALTGSRQKTGNRAGVTTELKEGLLKKNKGIKVYDLPGIYSLTPTSKDEKVVIEYLKNNPPDVIVNVIDGSNFERNFYLTTQLLSLSQKVVIAVNYLDQLKKDKIKFNYQKLSKITGVTVIPISALKGEGIKELIQVLSGELKPVKSKIPPLKTPACRYAYIDGVAKGIVMQKTTTSQLFSSKVDDILTHKYLGFIIFFAFIFFTYFISIKLGGFLGDKLLLGFNNCCNRLISHLNNLSPWLNKLLKEGIIKGVGTVLSFLPQVLILFSLLTIMEQCGYSSRIAFILDKFFSYFGLSGKSLIPIILSCGCTVTGLSATRTIENTSERRMTLFLAPFMPCGAKTAVFSWFSVEFFGGSALIPTSMYFLGILIAGCLGGILKNFKPFKSYYAPFILEIPLLRPPSIKDLIYSLSEKVKDFIIKAGSIVFLVSIALWFLNNFGVYGYVDSNFEYSYLYLIGGSIKYIFYPLGFGSPQTSVALISGIFAKEAVVETLCLLSKSPKGLFTNGFSAYAFMAFILLSPPCIASLSVAKKELKSKRWFFCMVLFQFLTAYVVAFLINLLGLIFITFGGLILSLIVGIIITLIAILCGLELKKCNGGCTSCLKGGKCKVKRYTT